MTFARRYLVVGVVVAFAVSLSALLGSASAAIRLSHKPRAAVRLRLVFHRVVTPDPLSQMVSNGRYVSFAVQGSPCCSAAVIDSDTGQLTTLPTPGCQPPEAINPRWLLVSCDTATATPTVKLYTFATGMWQTTPPVSPILFAAGGPDGVGNDWIEFVETPYHSPDGRYFENIATGEVTG
jgi:hypothetical protein